MPVIVDGDTLIVDNVIVRLHGIDAAESGQRCAAPDQKIVRPGDWAETKLRDMSAAGVMCIGDEKDEYGRLLAICSAYHGENINRTLVEDGLAWAFVKYSSDYAKEEAQARKAGLGIWAVRCEVPWIFRTKRWEVAIQKAPEGCPIKGNISERGRIYHTPWSRHYAKTKVDLKKGERWFCNEGEALKAGWRPPIR